MVGGPAPAGSADATAAVRTAVRTAVGAAVGPAADRAVAAFTAAFGDRPTHLVRSPGRVNLIGEHTDYNDGLCLPAAIDLELCLAIAPAQHGTTRPATRGTAGGGAVEVISEQQSTWAVVGLPPPEPPPLGPPRRADLAQTGWVGYVEGVVVMLAAEAAAASTSADGALAPSRAAPAPNPDSGRGWRGAIASDLPVGAGLSSSAALELAVARACAVVWGLDWRPLAAARLAHRAENGWVGAATGLLDQLACAGGMAGHALLVDVRDLTMTPVPLPEHAVVALVDTGTRRELVTSAYAQRRAECARAAAGLGVGSLRDVGGDLPADAATRLDSVAFRRARHVVSENRRVRELAGALQRVDLVRAGAVLVDGHRSIRDDFEVCGPELDAAVGACVAAPGCYGARMTGGGFAGCVVALVDRSSAAEFADVVSRRYEVATRQAARVHLCTPVDGTSLLAVPDD